MFMSSEKSNKSFILWLIWLFEGIFVGFGAILPGISGGTLCVAFGMYRPLIETISHPKTGLKKYWLMLGFFMLGIAVGFVGLSGVAAILLEKNTILVTCAFAGFIAGIADGDYGYALKLGTACGGATAFSDDLAVKEDIDRLLKTL